MLYILDSSLNVIINTNTNHKTISLNDLLLYIKRMRIISARIERDRSITLYDQYHPHIKQIHSNIKLLIIQLKSIIPSKYHQIDSQLLCMTKRAAACKFSTGIYIT